MNSLLHKNPSVAQKFSSPGNVKTIVQPKLYVNTPGDEYEQEADSMADRVMRMPANRNNYIPKTGIIGSSVQRKCTSCEEEEKKKKPVMRKTETGYGGMQASDSLVSSLHATRGNGSSLPPATKGFMENAFSSDFSAVRVHTDGQASEMSKGINAKAFTHGRDIYFSDNNFNPYTSEGKHLLAHELAHTIQQHGDSVQRKIEMRDVGKGEQSGFARLPELIIRLNTISQGFTYSMALAELTYTAKVGGTLSNFDTQMQAFIDQVAVIPLRLTNRHGLLGNKISGFNWQVDGDAWASGYVDIDDLLAADDLGMQMLLVHFIKERTATNQYVHRIGSPSLVGGSPEFNRVHTSGTDAEAGILRNFFTDPTIRLVNDSPSPTIRRVFRNSRGDLIRRRIRLGTGADAGVNASFVDVVTRDGLKHTPEEYLKILHP